LEALIGFDVPELFAFFLRVHFQAVLLRGSGGCIDYGLIPAVVVEFAIFVINTSILFSE
jgi:hypothetical protein